MNRRRILLSFALLALGLLVALIGALIPQSPVEIVVPINREALENSQIKTIDPPLGDADHAAGNVMKSAALSPVPDPRLIETSIYGHLPRKAENGDRPADIYARSVDPARFASTRPKLSIALLDAGISQIMTTEATIMLPADVSFIMSPYASEAERQIRDV